MPEARQEARRPQASFCDRHDWMTAAPGRLSRCAECGLLATAPVPRYDYARAYFTDEHGGGYDFDACFAAAFDAARFNPELDRLASEGLKGSILDIGCATGTFLMLARARGWTVTGVEAAEFGRLETTRRTGAVVAERCEDLPPGEQYDVVTLHHVLEHLHEPLAFLKDSVRPRVRRRLLVEVPNFDSLASRVEGSAWEDLRPEQHVWQFTAASLKALLARSGFQPCRAYTRWQPLWSLRAAADLGRLLAGAVRGDCRWDAAASPGRESDESGPDARRRYRTPGRMRGAAIAASRTLCRPVVRVLESAGLGQRLVVEAQVGGRR